MDEIFFFQYHLRINKFDWCKYSIMERRYLIDKYIQQKEMEQKNMLGAENKEKQKQRELDKIKEAKILNLF